MMGVKRHASPPPYAQGGGRRKGREGEKKRPSNRNTRGGDEDSHDVRMYPGMHKEGCEVYAWLRVDTTHRGGGREGGREGGDVELAEPERKQLRASSNAPIGLSLLSASACSCAYMYCVCVLCVMMVGGGWKGRSFGLHAS